MDTVIRSESSVTRAHVNCSFVCWFACLCTMKCYFFASIEKFTFLDCVPLLCLWLIAYMSPPCISQDFEQFKAAVQASRHCQWLILNRSCLDVSLSLGLFRWDSVSWVCHLNHWTVLFLWVKVAPSYLISFRFTVLHIKLKVNFIFLNVIKCDIGAARPYITSLSQCLSCILRVSCYHLLWCCICRWHYLPWSFASVSLQQSTRSCQTARKTTGMIYCYFTRVAEVNNVGVIFQLMQISCCSGRAKSGCTSRLQLQLDRAIITGDNQ